MRPSRVGLCCVLLMATATVMIASPQGTKPGHDGQASSSPRQHAKARAVKPAFTDVTARSGIRYRHSTRRFDNPYAHIMAGYTALGASVAVADFDGNGFEDIFVTDSCATCKNRLYRNNGDFTFSDVAESAGVANGNDAENASAAALWFDYNNDGRPDLFVVRFGHSILYENLGNGRFRDVTRAAGLDRYMNAIKAIAFDYDHDGFLDLFVGCYFQPVNVFHPNTPRFFPESFENANNGGGVVVFRNNGDGTFTDVTEKVGIHTTGWTLDLGHGDANNDGYDDLYVANDFGTDRFFVNNGNGTFTDTTETAIGFDTKKGMNADWGDFDNDGLLDIYVTNITDDYMREGNFLWHNNGNLTFSDVARETGTYDTGWGWGAKFFDFDNDGWLDLYVVNGWVSAGRESYVPDIFAMITRPGVDFADVRNWPPMGNKSLSGYQHKRLFHNQGGQGFKEEAARQGLDNTRDGRGIAVADFDNDGRLDLFVANANGPPNLYRNTLANGAHWVTFLLEGTKSNRDAVGAQVRLTAAGKTYLQFVNGGNGFAGQSTRRVHFGLGHNATIDALEVRWPSGSKQALGPLAPDRFYKIVEGERPSELPGENGKMMGLAHRALVVVAVAGLLLAEDRPAASFQRGMDALAARNYDVALDSLEQAVVAQPDDVRYASEYRQAAIQAKAFERSVRFFEKLVADHPTSANAYLNYGFALVDKIPVAGSITQVILANNALAQFSKAVELQPSWIAYYTRGNSYLFWPKVFNRTPLGVADLEKAVQIQQSGGKHQYYSRAYVSLGDAYWKLDEPLKARAIWRRGLREFPGNEQLKRRLALNDEGMKALLDEVYDPSRRVNTDLRDLWSEP